MSIRLFGTPGSRNQPSSAQRDVNQLAVLHELGLIRHPDKYRRPRDRSSRSASGRFAQDIYSQKNNSLPIDTVRSPSHRSAKSATSVQSKSSGRSSDLKKRAGAGMSGMLDMERTRTRRERTFVGSECAVCEEPLEHTLVGERILQFSCGHVSHEQCFYEYIKSFDEKQCPSCKAPLGLDTSRGNTLDLEKLSNVVRSGSSDQRSLSTPTQTTWDNQTVRPPSADANTHANTRQRESSLSRDASSMGYSNRDSRDREHRDSSQSRDKYGLSRHTRSDSEATGAPSSGGYPETTLSGPPRHHDYDVQAMESNLISPRASATRNPIPSPTVSVRSEFPTLTKSRQQQTLTCLITVEIPDNKWRPDPEDLRAAPPLQVGRAEEQYTHPPSPPQSTPRFFPYESPEALEEITESLRTRVENWHGLDFSRFGKLRLYGTIRVGKDKVTWQELECFLFAEMLICVKEKKVPSPQWDDRATGRKTARCALKGSILIRKHLNEVIQTSSGEENILTLSLSVAELPSFHLQFDNLNQLKLWQQALLDLNAVEGSPARSPADYDNSEAEEDDWRASVSKRVSSVNSSWGAGRSATTAPTEYTTATRGGAARLPAALHAPLDIVVVVPISSSMQGVKISLVRDALKFMVHNLGDRDRMGLVTFGSSGGGVPLVGMTSKVWSGWPSVLASIKPVGQKSHRADVVEGANVAMDLLMQRKANNPISTILLISDSSTSDADSVDFVVSRAEAAKIAIHSFGLGMTHKPDTMIELSTRTKASYTYVKDWMMLRECLAGCLGALQTMSHQNVKLKLRLPEGSPSKFVKISGALQITKRATGRDAEAALGDMRFGDKRDILVQLVISPDHTSAEQLPQDPWESIVSGLEALGGPLDQEDQRTISIEEVPLIQADLTWGDLLRDGSLTHLPRPSLLAITMLPATPQQQKKQSIWQHSPHIPPHPSVVQRRMELLTSDMLTRALTLVSRGQHDRAQRLLNETRTILKGLGKGGLPPIPPGPQKSPSTSSASNAPTPASSSSPTITSTPEHRRTPSPTSVSSSTVLASTAVPPSQPTPIPRSRSTDAMAANVTSASSPGIDPSTVTALDAELEASLEWIGHPAVFGRDSRKAVLQAISVINSQRGYTFRTPVESLWADRIGGIKRLTDRSREWREEGGGEGGITEES